MTAVGRTWGGVVAVCPCVSFGPFHTAYGSLHRFTVVNCDCIGKHDELDVYFARCEAVHVSATRKAFNNVFPYAENICIGGQKWALGRVGIGPWRVRGIKRLGGPTRRALVICDKGS